jgi:hypothetical protein
VFDPVRRQEREPAGTRAILLHGVDEAKSSFRNKIGIVQPTPAIPQSNTKDETKIRANHPVACGMVALGDQCRQRLFFVSIEKAYSADRSLVRFVDHGVLLSAECERESPARAGLTEHSSQQH